MNEIIQQALENAGAAFRKAIMAAWASHRDYSEGSRQSHSRQIARQMADDCIRILAQPKIETLTFSQKIIAFNAACRVLGIGYREMSKIAALEDENAHS